MKRTISLAIAFLLGSAVPIVLMRWAWLHSPLGLDQEDLGAVLDAAASSSILYVATTSPTVYVDVDAEVLAFMQMRHQVVALEPWNKRPEDQGCRIQQDGGIPVGPCHRNDFVRVELIATPLWRTALVSTGTFNTGHLMILFKQADTWRIIADRYVVQ